MRLAPRDELASLARVVPLLRTVRDLDRLLGETDAAGLDPAARSAVAAKLDVTPREFAVALSVVRAVRSPDAAGQRPKTLAAVLADGASEEVLSVWDAALAAVLDSEELDGIATALYTVNGPVGMERLFDAYAAASGIVPGVPRQAPMPVSEPGRSRASSSGDHGQALSHALEMLADLGVVELGTDEADGSLTVALSPLGTWGIHRRLRDQGWNVPVLGAVSKQDAVGLLSALARCDAEDGEAEITAWLAKRPADTAASELIEAAAGGSPGQRGAAFAVLDRIGDAAVGRVRAALSEPLLRAHAAVWLHERGEDVSLGPQDRTWLLVDLGAGLLEEASPQDVVAELLPDLPPEDQADVVAGLWQVDHPAVTDLLTALSEHHPDATVARAARKAAFKARSPASATGSSDRHPERS